MNVDEVLASVSGVTRREAEVLLSHLLQQDRTWLLAHGNDPVSGDLAREFHALAGRRAAHEPLQYLTRKQEFYGLEFEVSPAVLIPRPETEHLVEAVLLWATRFHDERTLRIVDVGTGSGAIAVALATHLAGAEFTAIDLSATALETARRNARSHGCEERIRFFESDLFASVDADESFDVIVSNPPYVASRDAATMQIEVVEHEPHTALFAGEDGLDVYRRLVPLAGQRLRSAGLLAMEIGYGQREALATLLHGWNHMKFIDDYQGIARVVLAEKP